MALTSGTQGQKLTKGTIEIDERKAATDHEESVAMDKNKDGNRGHSAHGPEIMAVGPECPREPQAKEGSGKVPRSA